MMASPKPIRLGIGGRLILAFLGVGSLAAGACVVGWLSYARLSQELDSIATAHLPALAFSSHLADAGAKVIATTPDPALAERREDFERIRGAFAERLQGLRNVLEASANTALSPELLVVTEAIGANLTAIDKVADRRFPLDQRIRAVTEELRWLQADWIEEVEPLVEDAKFNIEAALSRHGDGAPDAKAIRDESRKSEALLSVSAQANLIVGLLGRLATVRTIEDLEQSANFLGETADQLDVESKALSDWTDTVTVRQIAARLLALADAASGLPGIKRSELAAAVDAQALMAENRRLVTELGSLVSQEVTRTEAIARQAAERSAVAIRIGRNLLLSIAIASLLIAFVVGWFYVRRNLVTRLQTLTHAATHIAGGGSAIVLPPASDDELGDLSRALAVFRQTQDELIQAAKLAALGQMAAGISHELNQPLAAIRSYAHNGALLIERGRPLEARVNLERIQALTTRMADLIKHLKRFSRRPDTELGNVDLRQVVDGALTLFGRQFDTQQVEVSVNFPMQRLCVRAEEIRLEQVVVNLISNALDAVAGRGLRRIALCAQGEEGRVRLLVSDTGAGMPEEHRAAIFDPFFTTKPVGAGLGLGLSMSYNIIKDFGGTLSLAACGPDGTTFAVDLKEAA